MTLAVGDKAPDFNLLTDENIALSLSSFRGNKVILYFYPKDNTPGCTIEANDFKHFFQQYTQEGVVILGVSKDSVQTHAKFKAKHSLPFTLLSDPDAAICRAYGVYVEKSMFGKKYLGIERTTFLIDEAGIIRHIWRKVKVKEHAARVLEKV